MNPESCNTWNCTSTLLNQNLFLAIFQSQTTVCNARTFLINTIIIFIIRCFFCVCVCVWYITQAAPAEKGFSLIFFFKLDFVPLMTSASRYESRPSRISTTCLLLISQIRAYELIVAACVKINYAIYGTSVQDKVWKKCNLYFFRHGLVRRLPAAPVQTPPNSRLLPRLLHPAGRPPIVCIRACCCRSLGKPDAPRDPGKWSGRTWQLRQQQFIELFRFSFLSRVLKLEWKMNHCIIQTKFISK